MKRITLDQRWREVRGRTFGVFSVDRASSAGRESPAHHRYASKKKGADCDIVAGTHLEPLRPGQRLTNAAIGVWENEGGSTVAPMRIAFAPGADLLNCAIRRH